MPSLHGVHHSARPTWKLQETLDFYQNKLGLKLVHCLVAKGWGPTDQPDFLHFFFDSGNGSTIAFFYYLGTTEPEELKARDTYNFRAHHTAWNCVSKEELDKWEQLLKDQDIPIMYRVAHEVVESVYFRDPNGYVLEIGYAVREFNDLDVDDAQRSLQTAITMADERQGSDFSIEEVWMRKGRELDRELAEVTE